MSDIHDISSSASGQSDAQRDEESAGILSRSLSRRHLLALGAATSGALLLAGSAGSARADILDTLKGPLDLDDIVLNYAFEMEELQADFFGRVLRSDAYQQLESRERSVFTQIAMGDHEHKALLDDVRGKRGARGGGHFRSRNAASSMRPRFFKFGREPFASRQNLMPMAVEIKENCVAAYHGAVDLLRDKKLLEAAAAIAGVDGRHLVILREIAGLDPVPTSFELQISPQIIGKRLARFGFRGGAISGGQI